MAKHILRAALLSATLVLPWTPSAHADEAPIYWLQSGQWTVWQQGGACYLKNIIQTTQGIAAFGMFHSYTPTNELIAFHYQESNLTWQGDASVLTVQIDGNGPWKLNVHADGDSLFASLSRGEALVRFVKELEFGNVLQVFTNNGTRTFSLSGSARAFSAQMDCWEANTKRAPPGPAPGYPALAPPAVSTPQLAPAVPGQNT